MSDGLGALCALLRAWLGRERPVLEPPTPEQVELALGQRVAAIVYDLVHELGGSAAQAWAKATRPAFYGTLLRNDALLASALRATTALHGAGVGVVRLKGADLLLGDYPSAGLRPMDDIDLLVARAELPAAMAALDEAGFAPAHEQVPLPVLIENHFHIPLRDRRNGTCVELHWELMDRFKRGQLGGERVWRHALPIDPAEPALGLRLDAELSLVYLCLHVAKHGPFHGLLRKRVGAGAALSHPSSEARLLWLVDLALLTRHRRPDRARLEALMLDAGVLGDATTTLDLARELLGPERFPGPLPEPPPPGPGRRVMESLTARLLLFPHPAVAAWLESAKRMDETAQIRPLRLLELPLVLFPPFEEFRRARGLGRLDALFCYSRHVLSELGRGLGYAIAVARLRLAADRNGRE